VARVLICDDDEPLCLLLADYLGRQGFQVDTVHRAEAAIERLEHGAAYDVLVLDLMLPGIDGLAALKAIRARHAMPVIMLSTRGESVDRIVGLELGADDYLGKPCEPRELLARIQAVLRRAREPDTGAELVAGALRVQPSQRRAWLGDAELTLTGAEFSVLAELARCAGRLVSREQLTERGLHRPLERFDRAIDVHVSRLRQKLGKAGPQAPEIESVRGAGYLLKRAADAR
jgi:two-component system, OmpR family, response regulator CpxR